MSAIKYKFTTQQIIDEGRTTPDEITTLRAWSDTQKDLPNLTDEQLVLFLLSCNNEQEATKTTIKAYYSVRKKSPELFDNRSLQREDFQQYLSVGEVCVLPERTDDGCAIVLNRLKDCDHKKYHIGPHFTLLSMTVDAVLYEHPPKGLILVLDMQNIGLLHLTKIRLGLLKSCFQYLQEGLPVQLKNIHMLNSVFFLDKLMAIVKPISRQAVLDKMVFHQAGTDMATFYEKWIPKRCLPKDYGGDLPSVPVLHQRNVEKLINMQSHFEAEEEQRHKIDITL